MIISIIGSDNDIILEFVDQVYDFLDRSCNLLGSNYLHNPLKGITAIIQSDPGHLIVKYICPDNKIVHPYIDLLIKKSDIVIFI